MLKQSEIANLLNGIPLGMNYGKHLSNKPVTLGKATSLALGESERRLVRVLSTVVDAINNKLFTKSITVDDSQLQVALEQWSQATQFDLREREIYKYAIRDGRSYALVSWKNNQPVINVLEVFNGTEGAYIYYDNGNPSIGINTWFQGKDRYLDVYYPNRIEKYILLHDHDEWDKRKDVPNEVWPVALTDNNNQPIGLLLVEFSIGESDLADGAVQLQHDINTVIMDALAIDRTMGYPLRYISGKVNPGLVRNNTGQLLLNSQREPLTRAIELPPGSIYPLSDDATLGQLESATPDRTTFDMLLQLLSWVTKVPVHYFKASTTSDFPSGVALIQAESRLNHLVEDHQAYLTPAIVSLVGIMTRLSNAYENTVYNTAAMVAVDWESPQVLTTDLRMEIDKTNTAIITQQVASGVRSVESAVRILNPNWTEAEVQAEVAKLSASTLL